MHIQLDGQIHINQKPLVGELELSSPGLTLLQGANGSGKTTLFQFLKQNREFIDAKQQITFVDQTPLLPVAEMTVKDVFQTLYQVYPEKVTGPYMQFDLIGHFQFERFFERQVKHLSGGENQLLKLLLGFYQQSDFYFLDEPFHFLDSENFGKMLELIKTMAKSHGFFIIEHRHPELVSLAVNSYSLITSNESVRVEK
jgi:ABC-type multidrug transport system ATPase subunit